MGLVINAETECWDGWPQVAIQHSLIANFSSPILTRCSCDVYFYSNTRAIR